MADSVFQTKPLLASQLAAVFSRFAGVLAGQLIP